MRRGIRKSKVRPARIRTLPVRGKGDDAGRFYRCSYCGFICDIERDRLEGDRAKAGNGTQISVVPSELSDDLTIHSGGELTFSFDFDAVFGSSDAGAVAVLSGDLNFFHTAMENGMDGQAKPIRHSFKPDMYFGCPLCGTTNWKGK